MADIIILGAGMNGLTAAMLLANDGYSVTVLERDPAEPPADADAAWREWERRGVGHFRLPHFILPRWRTEMAAMLPAVLTEAERLGARRFNTVTSLPRALTGGERPGDNRFEALTARRPVLETAVANIARQTPGVEIRRGVAVAGLLAEPRSRGVPRVTGVVSADGSKYRAKLVVDMTGRHSALPAWLEGIGARPLVQEAEDCGFIYYARHFRARDGYIPDHRTLLMEHYPSVSIGTMPADNDTWSVFFVTSKTDRALRGLAKVDMWNRTLASYPLVAHWGQGEPLEGVAVMGGIEDRHRSLIRDDAPVATGILIAGDAWAATNPALGRGISMGAFHSRLLRDTIRVVGLDDHRALSLAFHSATMEYLEPIYRATVRTNRHRFGELAAAARGEEYIPEDPSWFGTIELVNGARQDPDLLRAYAALAGLQPGLSRQEIKERLDRLPRQPRYSLPGPSRGELLERIAA